MGNKKKPPLRVKDFFQKAEKPLGLKSVLGKTGFDKSIRPVSFPMKMWPIQVWGKRENKKLKSLSSEKRKSFLKKSVDSHTACVILAEGLSFFPETVQEAKRKGLALFQSQLPRRGCQKQVKRFLDLSVLGPTIIPGGLLSIFGLGVLIKGDSGIGKSESALELISRGHRFISDDVTQVTKTRTGKIIGCAPALSRYYMEIRGLGIINIKEIFGERFICQKSGIDLVIDIKEWQEGREYDRLGLKFPDGCLVLGEKIPQINIPVAPGRNIATLIEVACKVQILRKKGYFAPQELTTKVKRAFSI
jgi:HPr kinase/phosphorylase